MKYAKLILGIVILIAVGSEYGRACQELGTIINPGILLALFLSLIWCTWLIAGAFPGQENLKVRSLTFLKFYSGSLILSFLISFFSFASNTPPDEIININGMNISIGGCMKGSKRIVPDENERREYCSCLATELTSSKEVLQKYNTELANGRIEYIVSDMDKNGLLDSLEIERCFDFQNLNMRWTSSLKNRLKSLWTEQLTGTEFETTNDIEKYCDCVLNEYQKYPISEIFNDEFNNSELYESIEEKCIEESLKSL